MKNGATLAVATIFGAWACSISAAPPRGTDLNSPLRHWYERLKMPEQPTMGCCGYHVDCVETQARFVDDHWEAFYRPYRDKPDGRWIKVWDNVVETDELLPDHCNMAQKAVLCAVPGIPDGDPYQYCFVPPATSY
jgi:hypothetical protein